MSPTEPSIFICTQCSPPCRLLIEDSTPPKGCPYPDEGTKPVWYKCGAAKVTTRTVRSWEMIEE